MTLKTATQNASTNFATLVSNPIGSGFVIKMTSLFVSNKTNSEAALVDIQVVRDATSYSIMKEGVVPANKTMSVFMSKDIGIYLEEGDLVQVKSSSADSLDVICSYMEASPDDASCNPLCLE